MNHCAQASSPFAPPKGRTGKSPVRPDRLARQSAPHRLLSLRRKEERACHSFGRTDSLANPRRIVSFRSAERRTGNSLVWPARLARQSAPWTALPFDGANGDYDFAPPKGRTSNSLVRPDCLAGQTGSEAALPFDGANGDYAVTTSQARCYESRWECKMYPKPAASSPFAPPKGRTGKSLVRSARLVAEPRLRRHCVANGDYAVTIVQARRYESRWNYQMYPKPFAARL